MTHDKATPGCPGLIPHSIVALGTPSRPVERLIGTQAAVYRLILLLGSLRLPKLSIPRTGLHVKRRSRVG